MIQCIVFHTEIYKSFQNDPKKSNKKKDIHFSNIYMCVLLSIKISNIIKGEREKLKI